MITQAIIMFLIAAIVGIGIITITKTWLEWACGNGEPGQSFWSYLKSRL